jgi:lysophospholipase L1-like esterase
MRVHKEVIAAFSVGLLMFAQGMLVRKYAAELPEAKGPRTGVVGSGKPLRVLVLGDSSAAGVGVDTQDEAIAGQLAAQLADQFQVTWELLAKTGATTKSHTQTLIEQVEGKFDAAMICLGVNDVTRGVNLKVWLKQQAKLFDILEEKFGVREIYVSGVPPIKYFPLLPQPLRWFLGRRADRFDHWLADLVETRQNCHHIPIAFPHDTSLMASDGYHPKAGVYEQWAGWVADRIKESRTWFK